MTDDATRVDLPPRRTRGHPAGLTVHEDRMAAIVRQLTTHAADDPGTLHLCELAAETTGASGASIMLLSHELAQGSLCTTDGLAVYLDDLQFTLGEGPALDTHSDGRPVLEPDLAGPSSTRWPVFTPSAVQAGVRAVFAFPVRVGAVRLGALTVYRDTSGVLSDVQYVDALAMAVVATRTILTLQSDAPPGSVAAELEEGANFHLVVHQAAGMVSVQLGCGVTEALVRLRGHAFLADRPIDDVAGDVVARRLRLDGPGPG